MTVGIDYSMTCPAACAYTPERSRFWFAHESKHDVSLTDVFPDIVASYQSVSRRGAHNADKLCAWIDWIDVSLRDVWIEDYAYAASGRVFHIGEHTGILKHKLDNLLMDIHPVPPTVIKKFATGKGNADKHKMTAAFLAAFPDAVKWVPSFFPRYKKGTAPAKSPLADLADAYWIARYAYERGLTAA